MTPKGKLIILGCCILTCWGWLGFTYMKSKPKPAANQRRGPRVENIQQQKNMTQEQKEERRTQRRKEMQTRIKKDLNLTDDQAVKMKEIMQDKELSREEKFKEIQTFMTPEQQQKMNEFRQRMQARRAEREKKMSKLLSSSERAALEKKRAERRAQREKNGGGRGFGGPGGFDGPPPRD